MHLQRQKKVTIQPPFGWPDRNRRWGAGAEKGWLEKGWTPGSEKRRNRTRLFRPLTTPESTSSKMRKGEDPPLRWSRCTASGDASAPFVWKFWGSWQNVWIRVQKMVEVCSGEKKLREVLVCGEGGSGVHRWSSTRGYCERCGVVNCKPLPFESLAWQVWLT